MKIGQDTITMRPHHLLCTQGYSGKGYSSAFVKKMNRVVSVLRSDPDAGVMIHFGTDALCSACPSKATEDVCLEDGKVLRYDAGVAELLDLQEGTYRYQELITRLHELLTEEKLAGICGDCEWYPVSACRANILGGRWIL